MSWSAKLETKLSALNDSSSRESIQTVARWIAFNRKHAASFCDYIKENILTRQILISTLIHEILLLEQDTPKWDRLADLRKLLGEDVLLTQIDQLAPATKALLLTKIPEWDDWNVFGSPTLLSRLRNKLQTEEILLESPDQVKAVKDPESDSVKDPPATEVKAASTTENAALLSPLMGSTPTSISAPSKQVSYDFEGSGIPAKTIAPRAFLEPVRQIATLQIARDLRNDSAVQLSSLLSALPEDLRRICADVAETEQEHTLENDQARDFSIRVNDELLNKDLDEELRNVHAFRDICQRQLLARKQLIGLMIASRCEFGSREAAAAFLSSEQTKAELQRRQQILVDAMELEGLDVEEQKSAFEEPELAALSWYNPVDSEPEAKRQKSND
jgi:hypothetical protein